jgi:hypothetical protein
MRTFSLSFALALVLPALGCEVETLDVGDNAGGTGGSAGNTGGTGGASNPDLAAGTGGTAGTPSEPPPAATPRTCETDDALAKFVGVWEGAEENFTFDALRPLRLEIRGATTNDVCGSFLIGEPNPPPPASDPNADYPPAPWKENIYSAAGLDGVPYEITGGARGTSLRISISRYELWTDWCALREPVFDPEGNAYPGCIPAVTSGETHEDGTCTVNTTDYGTLTYPDFECSLCARNSVCVCTAAGCAASTEPTMDYAFTLSEEDGIPTLTSSRGDGLEFRLQRVD